MTQYHQEVVKVSKGISDFFQNVFESVTVEGPELDPLQIQRCPVMVASTHRSHVDYFFGGFMIHRMGFKNMRFAAGDNLTNLPWIGKKFKNWGAFAISRDTGFERHYVRNLCEQVCIMLNEKETVIVFPEGGRSYTGATLELKSGVLGAAVLTQARNMNRDVYMVPMAISYECPPDVPYFKLLLQGKRLRKRSNPFLKRLFGNMLYFGADLMAFIPFLMAKRLKRKYGKVYLDYGAPVSVKEIVDLQENLVAGARDEFSAHRVSMNKVSDEMHKRFVALYRILPLHLLSSVLITNKPMTFHQASLQVQPMLDKLLSERTRNLKCIESLNARQIVEEGVRQLLKLKAITVTNGLIEIRRHMIIEYEAATLA